MGIFIVIQVVCGQNCSFLVQSNGIVLAVGEGQYGRLGQGNSDDLYVPTIISAFQGTVFTQGLGSTSLSCSAFGCCDELSFLPQTMFSSTTERKKITVFITAL